MGDLSKGQLGSPASRAFLIDSENGAQILTRGHQYLLPQDLVIVFHRGSFPKQVRSDLESSACKVEWVECVDPGVKNSMDVQIIAEFGARLATGQIQDGFIVSRDRGFNPAIHYLQRYYGSDERLIMRTNSIEDALCRYAGAALSKLTEASNIPEVESALTSFVGNASAARLIDTLASLFSADASEQALPQALRENPNAMNAPAVTDMAAPPEAAATKMPILDFKDLETREGQKLTDLKGIGPSLSKRLCAIGIDSPRKLRGLGAAAAWQRIHDLDPTFSPQWVYAFEAAINECAPSDIAPARKQLLRQATQKLAS